MSVELTKSQEAAAADRGGSLLVSAAAGSGKTRVLVERLFRRVLGEEGANMDDFLIITYTRAAAAELRGRIAQELTERLAESPGSRRLQRQLLLVYQADIKTIDSFCTSLLRENVHLLDFGDERGLTADFRVLDENEAALLRRRVLPRVLEAFYSDMTPGAVQLADAFGFGRDDSRLEELVLELYGKVQSHAYPERWLARQRSDWASLPADAGAVVSNVSSAKAIADAIRTGMPLIERVVCVTGEEIQNPGNYIVKVGTSFRQILDFCGGAAGENVTVKMGGPMMGVPQTELDVPVIKAANGIIAVETDHTEAQACIKCGRCADVCPMELSPLYFAKYVETDNIQGLREQNIMDCIECRCCEYICSSKIPLVTRIREGKAAVKGLK